MAAQIALRWPVRAAFQPSFAVIPRVLTRRAFSSQLSAWPSDQEFRVSKDPMKMFGQIFEAVLADGKEFMPDACTLSTAEVLELENQTVVVVPNSRAVLLKDHSAGGFVFCTNRQSTKAVEISENPNVALNFLWKTLDLQIRVRGLVSLCPTEENDRHWQQRPRGSQLSAVASSQSEEIESYEDMMELKKQAEEHFRDMEQVPRPPHWGGYRVTPVEMEFWQGMPNRMHRRHVFRFEGEAEGWTHQMLMP